MICNLECPWNWNHDFFSNFVNSIRSYWWVAPQNAVPWHPLILQICVYIQYLIFRLTENPFALQDQGPFTNVQILPLKTIALIV